MRRLVGLLGSVRFIGKLGHTPEVPLADESRTFAVGFWQKVGYPKTAFRKLRFHFDGLIVEVMLQQCCVRMVGNTELSTSCP